MSGSTLWGTGACIISEISDLGRRMRLNELFFCRTDLSTRSVVCCFAYSAFHFRDGFCHARGVASAGHPRKGPIHWRCQAGHRRGPDRRTQPLSHHRKGPGVKYPVGVGRSGQQWFGTTRIASKHLKPAWKPPVSLRGKRSPDFCIEGGTPKNPMGAAALVLVDH